MCHWLQSHNPDKSDIRCDRMTNMFTRFYDSFSREDCGYFNPDVKNGGPNPDVTMKGMRIPKNPKSRRVMRERLNRSKRSDDESLDDESSDDSFNYADIEYETDEMTNEDMEYLDGCDGTETGALAEFCKDDGSIMKVRLPLIG